MNEINKRKNVFSEWLETLQQESWQLELLISGLALFGIWEARPLLLKLDYYISINTVSPYDVFFNMFVNILWLGWAIFLVNLLVHIVVRGLWIGAIGLRYVSGDIDYDEMDFSPIFRRYFKNKSGSFDNYIESLEKLSSVLFSFTFLLFFLFFSFVFINLVFAGFLTILGHLTTNDSVDFPIYSFAAGAVLYCLGLLVLIDFLTLGGFKRVKDPTVSKIYFWIYRFYSALSLSFIYRPLLLNFIDNKYTKRLLLLAIPYTFVILFGIRHTDFERYSFIPGFDDSSPYTYEVDQYGINWNNYDDLRLAYHSTYSDKERPVIKSTIKIASLDKYESDSDIIKLFLRYEKNDSRLLEQQHEDFPIFRNTGMHHRMFTTRIADDPDIQSYRELEAKEISFMRNLIKGTLDQLSEEDQKQFADKKEYYSQYKRDNISRLKDDIGEEYRQRRLQHINNKYEKAIKLIMDNYQISIDNADIKPSITPYFFTHNNMHEKGLLCLINIKELTPGEHMIKIVKKRYVSSKKSNTYPKVTKYIPFLK